MGNVFRIGARNLLRYKRRTALTVALIAVGVIFYLVFSAVSGSFKNMMVGNITDSFLGHLQVHRRGYLAAIENLPLHLNMQPGQTKKLEEALLSTEGIEAFSPRLKFGAAFSNFEETTNIRVNGVDPGKEFRTCPLLLSRIVSGSKDPGVLGRGSILVPVLIARGMGVKVGDTVVLVATNRDGSVNGKTFVVAGILESATGPGGRDGYVHIEDAREILRITGEEASEYAVRVARFDRIDAVRDRLEANLSDLKTKDGSPALMANTWQKLSPFSNIARMIDALSFFIRILLITVVLISILSVMIMAVYERVREIGTIAAIGTLPRRILSLFLAEGLLLGVTGAAAGSLVGAAVIAILNAAKIPFAFGQQDNLLLAPVIDGPEMLTTAALVIVVAVVASLQPAWKASRMEPIEALGHV
jgi:putative ABC transport system permease protein